MPNALALCQRRTRVAAWFGHIACRAGGRSCISTGRPRRLRARGAAVLAAHCTACHGPENQEASLSLAATDDQGGNLLERTAVLYGSGMNNGTNDFKNGKGSHGTRKLPLVVSGGEKLGLRQGQHLHLEGDKTPLCNLHVSLLHALGLEVESFSDAHSTLSGLS